MNEGRTRVLLLLLALRFAAHAPEAAMRPKHRAALEAVAARGHYTEEPVAALRDRNGRPAFDVFRFRKLPL